LAIHSGNHDWGGAVAADGSMYLGLQGNLSPSTYQQLTLYQYNTYQLSLYASSRISTFPDVSNCLAPLSVYIGSNLVLYVPEPPLSQTMQYYSTVFTYTDQTSATRITFANHETNIDCTVFVDKVTLSGKYTLCHILRKYI